MIVTTTPTIEGHTIKEYKGLVSGEVIFGQRSCFRRGYLRHEFPEGLWRVAS